MHESSFQLPKVAIKIVCTWISVVAGTLVHSFDFLQCDTRLVHGTLVSAYQKNWNTSICNYEECCTRSKFVDFQMNIRGDFYEQ